MTPPDANENTPPLSLEEIAQAVRNLEPHNGLSSQALNDLKAIGNGLAQTPRNEGDLNSLKKDFAGKITRIAEEAVMNGNDVPPPLITSVSTHDANNREMELIVKIGGKKVLGELGEYKKALLASELDSSSPDPKKDPERYKEYLRQAGETHEVNPKEGLTEQMLVDGQTGQNFLSEIGTARALHEMIKRDVTDALNYAISVNTGKISSQTDDIAETNAPGPGPGPGPGNGQRAGNVIAVTIKQR